MPKQKKYFKYNIPISVECIVKSVCLDYERREKDIKNSKVDGEILEEYQKLNNIIDTALSDIDIGVRKDMLRDIQFKRGYDFSSVACIMSRNTYYRWRKKLIYDIAKGLKLL